VLLAELLARGGDRESAEKLLTSYENAARVEVEKGNRDAELHVNLAAVSALRGDRARALRWLAYLKSTGYEPWKLGTHPAFASLRDEPAFRQLLSQINARAADMRRQVLTDRARQRN
jgi:hypothetical protein